MFIGVRSEPYLFHHNLDGFCLHLLLFLFLLIKKLLIINGLTNWRIGLGRNLNQVKIQGISNFQGL